MKPLFTFLFLLLCQAAFTQYEPFLEESSSHSILIKDLTVFTIHGIESSSLKRDYQAIIKSSEAESLREIGLYYDQFRSVKDCLIKVKDLNGNEIEKYKLKDLKDYGLSSGVATDGRVKMLELKNFNYPYRIEVSYEIEYVGSMHYPKWSPQSEEGMRVLSSRFQINDLSGNGVRYYPVMIGEPQVNENEEGVVYAWTVSDLSPYTFEDWNYDINEYTPSVLTGPSKFQMDGYEGEMSSWESFGDWISVLNDGRRDIGSVDLTELDARVGQAKSSIEKAAVVYDYLQNNTRYVSIQLGIGGWQPFHSSFVHEKNYGDCKALSNYMVDLLDRYGIKSYYTLIRAGKYAAEMPSEYPNAHFNHAIVTLPLASDTIFLECTSQTNPFGYLGTFTSNRNALMITEEGGKLVRTKRYTPDENLQCTTYEVTVNDASPDVLNVEMNRSYRGMELENDRFMRCYNEDQSENEKWFMDTNEFGAVSKLDFRLNDMDMEEGVSPVAGFNASFEKKKVFRRVGKRILLNTDDFFDSYLYKIKDDSTSKSIKIRYGYTQVDSLVINTPKGYYPNLDHKVHFENEFGFYEKSFFPSEGKLLVVRKFQFKDGTYSRDAFPRFKAFVNDVLKNDRKKIVLVNKT